ncbi:MAG: hypothetical protein ACKOAX_02010, partial [Candidatus Kapaibacterium sp.]
MRVSAYRASVLPLIILLVSAVQATAQLRIQFVDAIPMDGTKYPLYSARVRATLNGAPFVLTMKNLLVQEDVVVSGPSAVSDMTGGIQTVSWYSRNRNVQGGKATMVVFTETKTASATADTSLGLGIDSRTPQLRFTDVRNRRITELAFGIVPTGTTAVRTVFCTPTSGRFDAQRNEERVNVDSISTTTPFFKPVWRGGLGAWSLPGRMSSPLDYPVSVEFTPTDSRYYQDVMTVYYEGRGHATGQRPRAEPAAPHGFEKRRGRRYRIDIHPLFIPLRIEATA